MTATVERISPRVDAITRLTMPILGLRLWTAAAIAIVCAAALDLRVGLLWAIAATSAEIVVAITSTPSRRNLRMTRSQRTSYLAALVWMNLVWSSLAIVLWSVGRPGVMVAAICMLATQLLHAQAFAGHSRSILAAVAGPPVLVMIGLVIAFRGPLADHVILAAACAIMIVYMARAALENASQARTADANRASAVEASRAKSAFLAFIGHELRTPLTGVLGMSQALKSAPDNPGRAAQLDVLISSGQMMLDLLNDLLDISKIEAGRLELETAPFDVDELLDNVALLWGPVIAEKGLMLRRGLASGGPRRLSGDALRLRQILNNLISNAIKFTEEGAIAIQSTIVDCADGSARLTISVSDTGVGMTSEQTARLFRPFQQADVSIARRFGGTGLGLTICRSLIETMGGTVTVDSQPGRGSTFTIDLLQPIAEPSHDADADADADGDGLMLAGARLLLVDDNATNRLVGKTLIEALGAEVALAASGAEALAILADHRFDVVLMDIFMPEMDGVEALEHLRRRGERLPVIALTADGGDTRRRMLLDHGFSAVESKPIDVRSLAGTVARVARVARSQGA